MQLQNRVNNNSAAVHSNYVHRSLQAQQNFVNSLLRTSTLTVDILDHCRWNNHFVPGKGAKYCNQRVCLSVCVFGRGSVLL